MTPLQDKEENTQSTQKVSSVIKVVAEFYKTVLASGVMYTLCGTGNNDDLWQERDGYHQVHTRI